MEGSKKKNNYNLVKELLKLFKSIKEKSKILSEKWGVSEYDALLSLYDQRLKVMKLQNLLLMLKVL